MIKNKKHYYSMIDWTLKQLDKIIQKKERYKKNSKDNFISWLTYDAEYEIDDFKDWIEKELIKDFLKEVGDKE